MSDLISRQAAIKALYDYWSGCSFDGDGYDIADKSEDVLNELPSAEPERIVCAEIKLSKEEIQEAVDDAVKKMMAEMEEQEPRKNGKWIEIKHTFFHKCSVCSWLNDVDSGYSFFPRCGSYNGGEQDERTD